MWPDSEVFLVTDRTKGDETRPTGFTTSGGQEKAR